MNILDDIFLYRSTKIIRYKIRRK